MELCLGFSCDNGRLSVQEKPSDKVTIDGFIQIIALNQMTLEFQGNKIMLIRGGFFSCISSFSLADVYSRWIHTSLRSSAIPF